METSRPPHGEPRGLMNQVQSMGLPPWAAWVDDLQGDNGHLKKAALYRMSGVEDTGVRHKPDHQMDAVWMDEKIRMRTKITKDGYAKRSLIYPRMMKDTAWHSQLLDHWVQLPHVQKAVFHMEREGGFDNFILNRGGRQLQSRYAERMRRHLLVRRAELRKNFILERHAVEVARTMRADINDARSTDEMKAVLRKWGLDTTFLTTVKQAASDASAVQHQVAAALGDSE